MRYERREPRQEDLQQIEELKSVIDSQDHDLRLLTERLREMQLQELELLQQVQQQMPPPQPPRRAKNRNKPSPQQPTIVEDNEPQSIPIVCDVIYEENEAELIQEEQEAQQPVIVDVPESVIQTETNQVHSTEPVIVATSAETPVLSIEQIPESTSQASAQTTTVPPVQAPPAIMITEEGGSAEPASEVDICEVTVELPVKQPAAKIPPAEPVMASPQKVQNMPEMIVVRVPDVVPVQVAAAVEAIVSAPGPRSSST